MVEALGRPLRFILTAGQVHDSKQAKALLHDTQAVYVIADKGYDSDDIVEFIQELGAIPVIPSKGNRKFPRHYNKQLYKERNLIERCINKLKQFRRIATRYEKTLVNYMGLLYLAAAMIWLN